VYGTLIVDLERRRTLDLADYRKAAETVLPQCQQVADRWHLLKNLRDTLERLISRCRGALKPKRTEVAMSAGRGATPRPMPKLRPGMELRYWTAARQERQRQREQRFGEMQQLRASGNTGASRHAD
jgi:hypothetical protein